MSPIEKWELLQKFGDFILRGTGVRTLSSCKVNWYSYAPLVVMLFYISVASYTLYYFTSRDQFFDGLQCLCLSGAAIGVILPLHFALFQPK